MSRLCENHILLLRLHRYSSLALLEVQRPRKRPPHWLGRRLRGVVARHRTPLWERPRREGLNNRQEGASEATDRPRVSIVLENKKL